MTECKRFEDLIVMAADGLLDEAGQSELQLHLDTCPACSACLSRHTELRGAMTGWEEPVPAKMAAGVMYKIQYTDQGSPKRRRFAFGGFSMAAAALALFFLIQNFLTPKDVPQQTTGVPSMSESVMADSSERQDGDVFGSNDAALFQAAPPSDESVDRSESAYDEGSGSTNDQSKTGIALDAPVSGGDDVSAPPVWVVRLKGAAVPAELEEYESVDYGDHIEISVPAEEFDALRETLRSDGIEVIEELDDTGESETVLVIVSEE